MSKIKKEYPFVTFMKEQGVKNPSRLAKLCGVSVPMMHYIVTGKREPSTNMIFKLCHALNCKPRELFAKLPKPKKRGR